MLSYLFPCESPDTHVIAYNEISEDSRFHHLGIWGFHHIFLKHLIAWCFKAAVCKGKAMKSQASQKHRTIAAPALVNLCWWLTIPQSLHFTQNKASKKSLSLFFLSYNVSLNYLTSPDLGTIIWCLGENWSSLVTLCAGYFKIDLRLSRVRFLHSVVTNSCDSVIFFKLLKWYSSNPFRDFIFHEV